MAAALLVTFGTILYNAAVLTESGILVHGHNHFILSGPVPDDAPAVALARHWSLIQIGEAKSSIWTHWQIRRKEFPENLEWAVIVPGDRDVSPAVEELLTELRLRGLQIRRCAEGCW